MRKRQRISIDLNIRKPKLKINHPVSKHVNDKKDEAVKEVINNPYLAHTLDSSSTQSSISPPPPPPSPPPLPPPPPIINDTSSSLNYLLNYEDSSSDSELEGSTSDILTEKEKEESKEKELPKSEIKENSELMNSFETFLSEINELENKNNNDSQISTNAEKMILNNDIEIKKDLSLIKEKDNTAMISKTVNVHENSTPKDNISELSYNDSSVIIINKLAYLSSDKSIVYTTTPTHDYLYHQIEFSTRFKDWTLGVLNSDYFFNYHNEIKNLLNQIEEYFSPPGWKIQWDTNNSLYYYENKKTKKISWEYPKFIEAEPKTINQTDKKDDDDNMDLESDNEIIQFKQINYDDSIKKNDNKEEKEKLQKPKIVKTSIKDKNMLKLMQKWKKIEDSLNNSDESEDEKIERWAEEQKNKVDSSENPNFEPISINWREKILKRKELQNL